MLVDASLQFDMNSFLSEFPLQRLEAVQTWSDSWASGVLLVVTRVNLHTRPRPPWSDLSRAAVSRSSLSPFHVRLFLFECVKKRVYSSMADTHTPPTHTHTHTPTHTHLHTHTHTQTYTHTLQWGSFVLWLLCTCDFFSLSLSMCACVHECVRSAHTHTHTHTPIRPPSPMLSARRATSKSLSLWAWKAWRQRGPAERGVGLQRQLESQVATGSLESEVGLENKVSLGSELQLHEKRPKVVLQSEVGPEKPGEAPQRAGWRWSWRCRWRKQECISRRGKWDGPGDAGVKPGCV